MEDIRHKWIKAFDTDKYDRSFNVGAIPATLTVIYHRDINAVTIDLGAVKWSLEPKNDGPIVIQPILKWCDEVISPLLTVQSTRLPSTYYKYQRDEPGVLLARSKIFMLNNYFHVGFIYVMVRDETVVFADMNEQKVLSGFRVYLETLGYHIPKAYTI